MKTPKTRSLGVKLIALSAVSMLALTACSQGSATKQEPGSTSSGDGDSKTVVRYMNFSANGGNEETLAAIEAAFEAANTDIDVQIETLPYDDYFTKLQTAVAGKTVSDAFELNYENFVTYAASGALAEIPVSNASAYSPRVFEAFQHDGKQYGLPVSFSNVVLFYNKDLFDKAGLDYPTADWTWEDEQKAAEAITDKDAGVWGDYQPISFHEFYKALAQTGGQFLNDSGTEATIATPEGESAATWLIEKSGVSMPTEADGAGTPDFDTTLFKEGKLGMWHSGIWMFGGLAEVEGLNWDIVVEPGNTQKASALFANGAAISATSPNLEATAKWVEFLTSSKEMVDLRLEKAWELPPVADDALFAPYLEQTPPENRQAVIDSLDAIAMPPVVVQQQEMQDIVGEELSNAAAGRKDVATALQDAQDRINATLE
jgi:multiple sugar transport system substrate-binding protein